MAAGGSEALAGLGAGAVAGVLVGEGVYGLRYVADTTYPPFWAAEIGVGLIRLGAAVATRARSPRAVAVAAATTAVVAVGLVATATTDLVLPS